MGQEPIVVKPFTINTPNLPSNIGIQNTPAGAQNAVSSFEGQNIPGDNKQITEGSNSSAALMSSNKVKSAINPMKGTSSNNQQN